MSKIGAHVSIAGGLYRSIENAELIGAETFQIFGASARTWNPKIPDPEAIGKYRHQLAKSGLGPVFLHAPYLVNLASPDTEIWNKSIGNLTDHLEITRLLGAEGLVVHVGSGKGMDRKKALARASQAIRRVLKNVPGKTRLILENSAGGGDKIGSQLEDFSTIFRQVKSPRIKICFDTAHALEAGWLQSYTPGRIKTLLDTWDREVGLKHLVVIHANDSLTPYNSHHDRHENIGEGYIGLNGFKNLAAEKRLAGIPWILEVPGFDGGGPDRKNIELLKSCFK